MLTKIKFFIRRQYLFDPPFSFFLNKRVNFDGAFNMLIATVSYYSVLGMLMV